MRRHCRTVVAHALLACTSGGSVQVAEEVGAALRVIERSNVLIWPPAVVHNNTVEGGEDAHVVERLDASFRVRGQQRQQSRRDRMHPCFPGRQCGAGLVRAQHRGDPKLGADLVEERVETTRRFELHTTQPTRRDRCTKHIGEQLRAARHREMLAVHQIHGQRPHLGPPAHRRTRSFWEHTRGLVPTTATSAFHDMLRDLDPGRDQIDHLTHFGPDHDCGIHAPTAPTTAHRRMHDPGIGVTPTKMRTRRTRLLPRLMTHGACFGPPLRTLLTWPDPIRRRRLRTIRRILSRSLLQHGNPRRLKLDHLTQRHDQRHLLNNQSFEILSALTIGHTPIQPDRARRVVDPPEQLRGIAP